MIKLKDIFIIPPDEYDRYRLHFANTNPKNGVNPLTVFLTNKERWKGWNNSCRKNRIAQSNRNRQHDYIISFVQYKSDWLFAGVFAIDDKDTTDTDIKEEFVGRLIISYPGKGREYTPHMKTAWDSLIVKEIRDAPMEFRQFSGYKTTHLPFSDLKIIVENNYRIWREKLEAIKGIYLIYDTADNKSYIGSATGDAGIWQRWSDYVYSNATGGNKLLCELIKEKGKEYPRENFEFTLLEFYFENQVEDSYIIERETYWKNVLHSKDAGLNSN